MILKRLNFSDADYVIVWGGINDIYREIPLEISEKNLQIIYDQVHSLGGKVIAINITPSKGDAGWTAEKQLKTKELNTWIANSNADYKIDAYSLLENHDTLKGEYDFGDHLHLTQAGYFTVASEVFHIFSQQIKPSSN